MCLKAVELAPTRVNKVVMSITPGNYMRSGSKWMSLMTLVLSFSATSFGATIAGIVKGPDGAPFEGAFVQAQNTKARMTFMVLSNKKGHYRVQNLPAGEYRVQSK